MHLAVDGRLAGCSPSPIPIKANTADACEVEEAGLRIVMATGDGMTTARGGGHAPGHR